MKTARFFSFFFTFVLFSALLPLTTAFAAEQTLRVSPVIINVALSPDKTYTHEVTVENLTNAPLPIRTSLNDFLTADEEGGYIFEESKTNPLLSWTTLNETEFIINPKEKKTLQMTIRTPKSISLGGYYGVLFFEPVVQTTSENGPRVSSKVGVLMLANVGVPDPNAKKAEILEFKTPLLDQDGEISAVLRVKNISLNFFTAKPILTLYPLIPLFRHCEEERRSNPQPGEDCRASLAMTLEDKIIFPGKIRRWTETSLPHLSPNLYKSHLALSTGGGQYVIAESYFIVFPILNVLLIIIVLFALSFLITKRRRLKNAIKELIR